MKSFVIERKEYVSAIQYYSMRVDEEYIQEVIDYIFRQYDCSDNVADFLNSMSIEDFYHIYNGSEAINEDIMYAELTYKNSTWKMTLFDIIRGTVSVDIWNTEITDTEITDASDNIYIEE